VIVATSQLCRQFQFEIGKALQAQAGTEAVDRGFAHAHFSGQCGDSHIHDLLRFAKHVVGDLVCGFTASSAAVGEFGQECGHGFAPSVFFLKCNKITVQGQVIWGQLSTGRLFVLVK